MRRLVASGASDVTIAERLGRSTASVARKRQRLSTSSKHQPIPPLPRDPEPSTFEDQTRAFFTELLYAAAVAEKHGYTVDLSFIDRVMELYRRESRRAKSHRTEGYRCTYPTANPH
ncbi:MAG: hypothetical protein IMW91_00245 [Firmicutes bacterium]|nr:hypothetical protein [Bacillota bacterium]